MRPRHGFLSVFWLAVMHSCVCLASPGISFSDGGVSFGDIPIGTNAVRRLELRNTGSAPISVSRVKACCGAVAALHPMTVAPGGTAMLSVSFAPKSVGAFEKAIQVSCNDPERPMFTIPISGVAVESGAEGRKGVRCGWFATVSLLAFVVAGLSISFRRWCCRGCSHGAKAVARDVLFLSCRMVVGGVFAYAGAAKLCDTDAFSSLVARYDVLPSSLVPVFSAAMPVAEIAFGGLLVLGRHVRLSSAAVSLMLAMFITALTQAAIRGLDVTCGCFGGVEVPGRSGVISAMLRDILLLSLSVPLVFRRSA